MTRRGVQAVLDALQMKEPCAGALRSVSASDWRAVLDWCDGCQVTLLLRYLHGNRLPEIVQDRMEACQAAAVQRFARLQTELSEVVAALNASGIEFVLLKGMTHAPGLSPNPIIRAQGDIDLWFDGESVYDAREVLSRLGYVARPRHRDASRHLAPMVRPNAWQWRGDRFDPDIPISVELHHTLWSDDAEYIRVPGIGEFRNRTVMRTFGVHAVRVLCEEDLLGFAALHFLLHLVHGDLPLQRAWEIARFLHTRCGDVQFWRSWEQLHSPELRLLEFVAFDTVRRWFGCAVPQFIAERIACLPDPVRGWLCRSSRAPLERTFRPNKDELWLHLALIPSRRDRARVLLRRLVPNQRPKPAVRWERLWHHARTLAPAVTGGARYLWNGGQRAHLGAIDPHSTALPMPRAHSE